MQQPAPNKPKSLRTTGDDQRKFSRFNVRLSGFVTPVPAPDSLDSLWYRRRSREQPAIITDLSAAGLHFICESNYEVTAQVWISMQINSKTYPIRGIIRRQSSQMREGKKIYSHGLQFMRSDFAAVAIEAIMAHLHSLLSSK